MKALFVVFFMFSSAAFARNADRQPTQSTVFSDGDLSGAHNVYIGLIPFKGTLGLTLSYEKPKNKTFGYGATFTYLPQKGDTTADEKYTVGLTAIGANVVAHYAVEFMDFYVKPGLNLMIMDDGDDDKTAIGGSLALGTLAQLSPQAALGLEYQIYQPWFNKDFYEAARWYYQNTAITFRWSF